MKLFLDLTTVGKCYRLFCVHIDSGVFCFTTIWYYKERYDDGIGLFRISMGKFIQYGNKAGFKIELLGFSWSWFRSEHKKVTV